MGIFRREITQRGIALGPRGMQDVGRIESDRTNNETDVVKNILNYNIRRFKLEILLIY